MKHFIFCFASLMFASSCGLNAAHSPSPTVAEKNKAEILQKVHVIYGNDYRHEPYESTDPIIQKIGFSTVALINVDHLSVLDSLHTKITGSRLGDIRNYCSTERYLDQIAGAECSGFLIAPDLVATAGHCIPREYECKMTRYIFGYAKKTAEDSGTVVPNSDIYECANVVYTQNPSAGSSRADFALVRLTRPVLDRSPLPIRTKGLISAGDSLSAVGFPQSVPMKFTDHGFVRNVDATAGVFTATLDLFKGNSGSPVFNPGTGVVEGVVYTGETDIVMKNGCWASNVCAVNGCSGEGISLSANFLPYLN